MRGIGILALVLAGCSSGQDSLGLFETPVVGLYELDTDRDGHSDGDELDGGSDPNDCTSVPGPRAWPDCLAEARMAPEGDVGWGMGQRAPNWTFSDQHGRQQEFWRFHGTVLMLEIWPFW